MVSHARTSLIAVGVLLMSLLPAGAVSAGQATPVTGQLAHPTRGACSPGVSRLGPASRTARQGPAQPHDAGGEGRPDDAGRARCRRRRSKSDRHAQAGFGAVRRWLDADAQHARRLGRHGQRVPEPGAQHTPGYPHHLWHRRRPRSRERLRRDGLPTQHRPRLHPRPSPREEGRGGHGGGGTRDRNPVELRAVRLCRPRRALGPHVRELRRGPDAGLPDGDDHRRPAGSWAGADLSRPCLGHREALCG